MVLPTDLGSGVKLANKFTGDELETMRQQLNAKKQFRVAYGQSISTEGLCHLICEVRQWTIAGMKEDDAARFVK